MAETAEHETEPWSALRWWGADAVRVERLTGGVANDVWTVRVGGELAVGRLGSRSDADLAWEAELLLHLDREGLTVPVPLPTTDGRLFVDGLMVMSFVEGTPPTSDADWRRVAEALRHLHRVTQDWPQRPGWRASTDLLNAQTGTKVDLSAMPAEGVARCRAAWARLVGRNQCVVHGDSNNVGNVLVTAERVALIDWDEAHVDVPALDLVLPDNAADLDDSVADLTGVHLTELEIASQASAAWEAAVCWDDDHARHCLAQVRPLDDHGLDDGFVEGVAEGSVDGVTEGVADRVFRDAVPADADAVAAYHQRCVASTFATLIAAGELVPPDLESTRAQLSQWFEPGSALTTTIALVDDAPIAHLTVEGHQLVHLFVDPQHQGTGLGRELLGRAEAAMRAQGHHTLELHVRVENARAISFYERAGWTMTERRIRTTEHAITYDEHVMVKQLGRAKAH